MHFTIVDFSKTWCCFHFAVGLALLIVSATLPATGDNIEVGTGAFSSPYRQWTQGPSPIAFGLTSPETQARSIQRANLLEGIGAQILPPQFSAIVLNPHRFQLNGHCPYFARSARMAN